MSKNQNLLFSHNNWYSIPSQIIPITLTNQRQETIEAEIIGTVQLKTNASENTYFDN